MCFSCVFVSPGVIWHGSKSAFVEWDCVSDRTHRSLSCRSNYSVQSKCTQHGRDVSDSTQLQSLLPLRWISLMLLHRATHKHRIAISAQRQRRGTSNFLLSVLSVRLRHILTATIPTSKQTLAPLVLNILREHKQRTRTEEIDYANVCLQSGFPFTTERNNATRFPAANIASVQISHVALSTSSSSSGRLNASAVASRPEAFPRNRLLFTASTSVIRNVNNNKKNTHTHSIASCHSSHILCPNIQMLLYERVNHGHTQSIRQTNATRTPHAMGRIQFGCSMHRH